MVTWNTIECIERNGIITNYTVVFQKQGGANVPGNTVDRTFSAGGLTPGTVYTFQVAGVNDAGTGVFSTTDITTNEEGLNIVVEAWGFIFPITAVRGGGGGGLRNVYIIMCAQFEECVRMCAQF